MKFFSIFFIFLFFSSCKTPYQRVSVFNYTGGYVDDKINENTFRIKCMGNQYTDLQIIKDYALLRSAEVTLENGFNFFEIIESDAETLLSAQLQKRVLYAHLHGHRLHHSHYDNGGICHRSSSSSYITAKPFAMNKIVCYKNRSDKKDGSNLLDAKKIVQELRLKYNL